MPLSLRLAGSACAALAALLLTAACGGRAAEPAAPAGEVRIAVNGWVGSQANAAVAARLLERELGYTVDLVTVEEQDAWHDLGAGGIDAILDNWGRPGLMKQYSAQDPPLVVDGGPNGTQGRIGWYVPAYLAEEYPEITAPDGLAEHTDLFRPEPGEPGRFLAADPGFITRDQELIDRYGLDLEIDYAGSEEAQVEEVRAAYDRRDPVLFYFYEPQWLFAELDLVRVDFPDGGCGETGDAGDAACTYAERPVTKVFSTEFAESGSAAHAFLDAWQWTNADQDRVAQMISGEGRAPAAAADAWISRNADAWREWMPAGH
ncbi:glycine betaine ABC transporter substrate-binding protein [Nocardiopsis coralliicola]